MESRWSSTPLPFPMESGTPGMRASLVSREVIADSAELAVLAHEFDGMVVLCGCDKTIPGTVMAPARLNLPGLAVYGGSIQPGRHRGKTSPFRTCSRPWVPMLPVDGRCRIGRTGTLRVSRCGVLWWTIHRQHHGDCPDISGVSPMGLTDIPATDRKASLSRPRASGCDCVRRNRRPRTS